MFVAALFSIARTWKQPRCPSTDKWIKKLWYVYTMEYYSAIKRNTFESVLMRWVKLELVTQSAVNQKNKFCVLTHMFPSCSLHSSCPLLPLLCPQICSLCLLLHCCPANRIISTIFLDSIYMSQYTIFIFLFLTYFPLYNRLYVHPPH